MMRRILSIVCLVAATFTSTAASNAWARSTPVVQQATQHAEIVALLDKWSAALKTGNPQAVNALYTPDALLLPTKSHEARSTPAQRIAYFRDFLQKYPGVEASVDADPARVIDIAGNKASDTGHYTFRTSTGALVKARYTFTYNRDAQGKWLISSHHSSALPD